MFRNCLEWPQSLGAQKKVNEVISKIPKTAAYEIILVSQMFHYCARSCPQVPRHPFWKRKGRVLV